MTEEQKIDPIKEMNKAISSLRLELPDPVWQGVLKKWQAADYFASKELEAKEKRIAELQEGIVKVIAFLKDKRPDTPGLGGPINMLYELLTPKL